MITYLIKVILCTAVFILTYKLLLEKEKMHRFNRFYLLISLALSFIIPTIRLSSSSPISVSALQVILHKDILQHDGVIQTYTQNQESTNDGFTIISIVYLIFSLLLFLRFAYHLFKILSKSRKNISIAYNSAKIILIDEDLTVHSFLNFIFINRKEYTNGNIEPEILLHEYAHIVQKHSYDILLLEILQTVFWFNPIVFIYRKAIQLNHEFLADEAVVKTSQNIASYQNLLIERANKNSTYNLTSQFNYSITKKRLIMMTKTKLLRRALCKQIATIPVFAMAAFVFSTNSFAQEVKPESKQMHNIAPSTQEGVTKELLNEYEQIVQRATNAKGFPNYNKFSEADKKRLESIYLSMSKAQQAKQIVIFIPALPPSPKTIPTNGQLASWKNPHNYGLWIDNKKVSNNELNKYNSDDFAHYNVSKLYGAAKKNVSYSYQVNLMTIKEYDNYYKKTMENKNSYYLGIRMGNKQS